MKKIFLLLTLATFVCLGANAQKFGTINSAALIGAMPDRDSAEVKLQEYATDLQETAETIQVELNNLINDYQKAQGTMSAEVRQLKEKEIYDLQVRQEEFNRVAQEGMQNMQQTLMAPIVEKAQNAIKKVSKDNGFIMVFDSTVGAFPYYDETQVIDILPLVKTELGLQ